MKNPIIDGWYADPEARVYNGKVYIYVTRSLPFEEQHNLDIIVSDDLIHFTKKESILDMSTFKGATFAIWAPSVVEQNGRYYIIFAANNIHKDGEDGGLYIGVSDSPCGPFKNIFPDGRPFINVFYNGAQPIDAHFFKDGENIWLYYGGKDYVAYHRRIVGDKNSHHRILCIDELKTENGRLTPVIMTEA